MDSPRSPALPALPVNVRPMDTPLSAADAVATAHVVAMGFARKSMAVRPLLAAYVRDVYGAGGTLTLRALREAAHGFAS